MSTEAIAHYFSDGVYAKQLSLKKGDIALTHVHKYDHLSILASGSVVVIFEHSVKSFQAPDAINIKAGVKHAIEALEDSVFFCVHATDETDINKVDEVLIEG